MKTKISKALIWLGIMLFGSSLLLGQPSRSIDLNTVEIYLDQGSLIAQKADYTGYILSANDTFLALLNPSETKPKVAYQEAQWLLKKLNESQNPFYAPLYFIFEWNDISYARFSEFVATEGTIKEQGEILPIEDGQLKNIIDRFSSLSLESMTKNPQDDWIAEPLPPRANRKGKIKVAIAEIFFKDKRKKAIKGYFFRISQDSIRVIVPSIARKASKGRLVKHIIKAKPGLEELPKTTIPLHEAERIVIRGRSKTIYEGALIGLGTGFLASFIPVSVTTENGGYIDARDLGYFLIVIPATIGGMTTGAWVGNIIYKNQKNSYQSNGLPHHYQRISIYENWRSIHTQLQNLE